MKKNTADRIKEVQEKTRDLNEKILLAQETLAGFCYLQVKEKGTAKCQLWWDPKKKVLILGTEPLLGTPFALRSEAVKRLEPLIERCLTAMEASVK